MKNLFPKYLILLLMLSSCATTKSSFNKKEYRRSKSIAIYSGMADELQDGYLVLKENGYFEFYQKLWVIISMKEAEYIGHYSRKNDTLYLDWLHVDPKQIKSYLSSKCIIKTSEKEVWFVDEITNERLWGLSLASRRDEKKQTN
jgi:hypothetical protein